MMLYPKIKSFIASLKTESIGIERKSVLGELIKYIQDGRHNGKVIRLNFICTHNSRRSHLAQIWAQTLSRYFTIENVDCYSGGTMVTAVYPEIVKVLKTTGFNIENISGDQAKNPVYSIKFGPNEMPIIGFSKLYDYQFNPTESFAAILTCSTVDKNCPVIPNAILRIPITYDDPKIFDHSPQRTQKYQDRCLQIATEMYYVFSSIK